MAKLSVVIFAICCMCLLVFNGVFAAEEQAATTLKPPAEAVTNPVTTTPQPPKTTIKSADVANPEAPSDAAEKDDKTKDPAAGAQPSTQTTEAPKAAENTKGNGNGSSAVVANAMLFVSAVYMCTRF